VTAPVSGQLSFFSAGAHPPAYADLDGLLAGPGQVVRRGAAARVSVLLLGSPGWRSAALAVELAGLRLAAEVSPAGARGGTVVRTAFDLALGPLAERWTVGAVKRAPSDLHLDGARLRWWCLAAGWPDPAGFRLGLGTGDDSSWPAIGAALAGAGVPATLVRPRADRPAYRIVGDRRLARLRELVGSAPAGAGPEWPASDRRPHGAPVRG